MGSVIALPGGRRWLALIRGGLRKWRAVAGALRHPRTVLRYGATATPWKEHDRLVLATRFDQTRPFLSTNQLAGRCRYIFLEDRSFLVNEDADNDWYFVRTEDVAAFFDGYAPSEPFVLFTGHSDLPIDRSHRRYLARPELKAWFAVNPVIKHRKLRARPIGVVSPCWPNGDSELLHRARQARLRKTRLFQAAFTVANNSFERSYCLAMTGVPLGQPGTGAAYLEDLASSYFCLSPKGAGIDCCRTWEALVVGTVPVVTRSLVTEQHADFPVIALDDWAEFRTIDFTPELYDRAWGGWDSDELLLDRYLERVEREIAQIGTLARESVP